MDGYLPAEGTPIAAVSVGREVLACETAAVCLTQIMLKSKEMALTALPPAGKGAAQIAYLGK